MTLPTEDSNSSQESGAIHADTKPERKVRLDKALRDYYGRDTEAMIRVLHFLCAPDSGAGV